MGNKHMVRINENNDGNKRCILEGAERRLPGRILRWLFGDFTTVYLLSPGQSVESIEIHELRKTGCMDSDNSDTT